MSTSKYNPASMLASLLGFLRIIGQTPAIDWVVLFLIGQFFFQFDGGTNVRSRWCTMVSIVEDRTLHIDNYWAHTIDWAQTPDKHYYSNKAPGPMLLGLPVFWYLDRQITAFAPNRGERDGARIANRESVLQTLSFTTQALPYALVVLWVLRTLQKRRVPVAAVHVCAVALLFGNTASLLMSVFFGHAMAAMFVLASFLALHHKRYGQAGLYLGLGMLCDYAAALLLLPTAIVMLWEQGRRLRRTAWLAAGGLIPGVVWCWYHQRCFGSPLALPNKFQNPLFVNPYQDTPRLWGAIGFIPDSEVIGNLLYGKARGLLFTQGWILVSVAAGLAVWFLKFSGRSAIRDRLLRESAIFSFVGLILILFLNCSFNGWHGGWSPGPRYLACILPCCALTASLVYARSPAFFRQLTVMFVMLSTLLCVLLFGTKMPFAPEDSLFDFLLNELFKPGAPNLSRTLYLTLAVGVVAYRAVLSSVRGRLVTSERTPR